jgi:hypothetical protein
MYEKSLQTKVQFWRQLEPLNEYFPQECINFPQPGSRGFKIVLTLGPAYITIDWMGRRDTRNVAVHVEFCDRLQSQSIHQNFYAET